MKPSLVVGIKARTAPVAVLFRRTGHRKWQAIRWDLAQDQFVFGEEFECRFRIKQADLSPDGELLAYRNKAYALAQVPDLRPIHEFWTPRGYFRSNECLAVYDYWRAKFDCELEVESPAHNHRVLALVSSREYETEHIALTLGGWALLHPFKEWDWPEGFSIEEEIQRQVPKVDRQPPIQYLHRVKMARRRIERQIARRAQPRVYGKSFAEYQLLQVQRIKGWFGFEDRPGYKLQRDGIPIRTRLEGASFAEWDEPRERLIWIRAGVAHSADRVGGRVRHRVIADLS